jgi:aspartate aminotransferase-like enzyme
LSFSTPSVPSSKEIQMDSWGIDVVITASQKGGKGLGAPPGLSIVIASQKATKVNSASRDYCSGRIKAAAKELWLSQLPIRPEIAANGMTPVSTTNFISELVDEPRVPSFN